jgi:hypothetical protein
VSGFEPVPPKSIINLGHVRTLNDPWHSLTLNP